ncbi:Adhesion G protein-coupled receptor B2 [Trichoplax sp. H2]|uniref:G-protein coupled receptors family 2 profile 2 domain-containing protein n=1 Tax=Trichoplax adhaerens TaxID=10228 RepID=B3S285_TRIAD|nr:predicted protein [Trichoplax adhaerens]EDV23070.1 predicted protein [Trichoplax adhaerens]RDD41330.1 Adhesion G protein-coupled receptor B2 [Trichoplax sp. H2]|eukprot:XP_002113980.1 predicted protein [Trichoplax adhaerens]
MDKKRTLAIFFLIYSLWTGQVDAQDPIDQASEIMTYLGCLMTILSLMATIFTYAILWSYLKSKVTIIRLNLHITLLLTNICIIIGVRPFNALVSQIECIILACSSQYLLLAFFIWMLLDSFAFYYSVIGSYMKVRLLWLYVFAYGFPGAIVAATLGIVGYDKFTSTVGCWLSQRHLAVLGFLAPLSIIFIINIVIIILTYYRAKKLATKDGNLSKDGMREIGITLRDTAILVFVCNIGWILGSTTEIVPDPAVINYIFMVFTSLQGFFILIVHCLKNNDISNAFNKKFSKKEPISVELLERRRSQAIVESVVESARPSTPAQFVRHFIPSNQNHGDQIKLPALSKSSVRNTKISSNLAVNNNTARRMSDIATLFQRGNRSGDAKKKLDREPYDDLDDDELDNNFFSGPGFQTDLESNKQEQEKQNYNPTQKPVIRCQPYSSHDQQKHAYTNPSFQPDEEQSNIKKKSKRISIRAQSQPTPSTSSVSSDEDVDKLPFNKLTAANRNALEFQNGKSDPSAVITSPAITITTPSPTTTITSSVNAASQAKNANHVKFDNHIYKLELEQRYSHQLKHIIYEDSEGETSDGIASPYSIVSTVSSLGEISQNEIEPPRSRIKTFSGVVDVFKKKASDNVRCQSMSSKKSTFKIGKLRS